MISQDGTNRLRHITFASPTISVSSMSRHYSVSKVQDNHYQVYNLGACTECSCVSLNTPRFARLFFNVAGNTHIAGIFGKKFDAQSV